jgi:hypothetical protein
MFGSNERGCLTDEKNLNNLNIKLERRIRKMMSIVALLFRWKQKKYGEQVTVVSIHAAIRVSVEKVKYRNMQ